MFLFLVGPEFSHLSFVPARKQAHKKKKSVGSVYFFRSAAEDVFRFFRNYSDIRARTESTDRSLILPAPQTRALARAALSDSTGGAVGGSLC